MKQRLWGHDDPVFPATRIEQDEERRFHASGLSRNHWANAGPIRHVFKEAFTALGMPYFNPHSFRHALVRLGERVCKTPEQFKAWSQNLGHEQVLTTFNSYGNVPQHRQAEIIKAIGSGSASDDQFQQLAEKVAELMGQKRN